MAASEVDCTPMMSERLQFAQNQEAVARWIDQSVALEHQPPVSPQAGTLPEAQAVSPPQQEDSRRAAASADVAKGEPSAPVTLAPVLVDRTILMLRTESRQSICQSLARSISDISSNESPTDPSFLSYPQEGPHGSDEQSSRKSANHSGPAAIMTPQVGVAAGAFFEGLTISPSTRAIPSPVGVSGSASPLSSPKPPLISPSSIASDSYLLDDSSCQLSPAGKPPAEKKQLRASSSLKLPSHGQAGSPSGNYPLATGVPSIRRATSGRLNPKPPVEPLRLGPLISAISECNTRSIREAACSVRMALKGSKENKQRLIQAGGIPFLVHLLGSEDPVTVEHGVTALFNVCRVDSASEEIAAAGGLEALVKALSASSRVAQENAAAAIFCLSDNIDHRTTLCNAGAFPGLTEILRTGTLRGQKDAALAIFNLLKKTARTAEFIATGGVTILVDLLQHNENGIEEKAVAVLAFVAKSEEGRAAILQANGVLPIVDALELPCDRAREDAVSILLNLCSSDAGVLRAICKEGVMPSLHRVCQSESERAKLKAQALLSLLRSSSQGSGPLVS